ncbi:unnamed protein product [Cylicocyclus nassatus]|uniref:Uncharacterized protein n=1 Tax=Cylicocyclus nassatus TaxID=53992 RepID=A0AA36GFG6_CYLNA|nr:unnamed protein product [Cylicocyclus nassatus]
MLLVASLVLLPSFLAASDQQPAPDQEPSDLLGACSVEKGNCKPEPYDEFWDPVMVALRNFLEKPDLCFSCDLGKGAQELAEDAEVVGYEENPRLEFSLYYYSGGSESVKPESVITGLNMSSGNQEVISKVS